MLEYIDEYLSTKNVGSKETYRKRITACVEILDSKGITSPTEADWDMVIEALTADGAKSEGTVKKNYVSQAKTFYRWCVSQTSQPRFEDTTTDKAANDGSEGETPDNETITAPAMTDETESDKAEETQSAKPSKEAKDKSVRINFLLDKMQYKKLAILSVLEDKSLTDLLKEGIDLCIAAHETQAAIAEHAVTQSADARSE